MPIPIFIHSLDYIIIDHGPYLDNSNLAWKIDTESTCVLVVTWLNFSTEEGYDFVSVTDLELNMELGMYSGALLPTPTISHGSAYVVSDVEMPYHGV